MSVYKICNLSVVSQHARAKLTALSTVTFSLDGTTVVTAVKMAQQFRIT
jgi:hypothetical protein